MTSFREKEVCRIAPLPIGQFYFLNESHDFVVVLIDCDWSRKSHDLIQKPLQFSTGLSSSGGIV